MTFKSLNDPFNPEKSLLHEASCECPLCASQQKAASGEKSIDASAGQEAIEKAVFAATTWQPQTAEENTAEALESPEAIMDRAIEFENGLMDTTTFLVLVHTPEK